MRLLGWGTGHERVRELLSAYLDNAVSAQERTEVERHLTTCAACRAELDGLRATILLLRDLPPAPLRRSFTLTPELAQAAPQPQVARLARLPAPALAGARWAMTAAAALFVAVVSYDVATAVLPAAHFGAVGQAVPSRALPQAESAAKAAPGPAAAPAAAPRTLGAPAPAPPGGAAGVFPTTGSPPPVAPAPALPAAPADVASQAAVESATARDSSGRAFDPLRREATETSAVAPPQRQAWVVRWLEAVLATVTATAAALWWWGRRPA